MDKKQIEKRRKEAEDSFNALQQQKQEHQDKVQEIDAELLRLQGEHRALGSLLEKPKKTEADTIDVTDVKGA